MDPNEFVKISLTLKTRQMYTGARLSHDGVTATTIDLRLVYKKELISLLIFFRIQIGNVDSVFLQVC